MTGQEIAAPQLQLRVVCRVGRDVSHIIAAARLLNGILAVIAQAVDAIAEVFVVALLPDRKLKAWSEQQLPSGSVTKKEARRSLMYMYLEDCIKTRCADLLHITRVMLQLHTIIHIASNQGSMACLCSQHHTRFRQHCSNL